MAEAVSVRASDPSEAERLRDELERLGQDAQAASRARSEAELQLAGAIDALRRADTALADADAAVRNQEISIEVAAAQLDLAIDAADQRAKDRAWFGLASELAPALRTREAAVRAQLSLAAQQRLIAERETAQLLDTDQAVRRLAEAEASLLAWQARVDAARAERDAATTALAEARRQLDEAQAAERSALAALHAAEERSGLWEPSVAAAGTGIPSRVLDVLRWAESELRTARPGCGLDWALLGAISSIESDHARFGGAVLRTDGTVSPPIRGVALDGNGVAYIADTDGGAYDRDATLDRAVGPFQFIPSTWASYGQDGNGDGVADPQNLWDSALAAGTYLCATGGDLTLAAGERRAILAYNYSSVYLADVQALARWYRQFRPGLSGPVAEPEPQPVPTPTTVDVPMPPAPPEAPVVEPVPPTPEPPVTASPSAEPPQDTTATAPPATNGPPPAPASPVPSPPVPDPPATTAPSPAATSGPPSAPDVTVSTSSQRALPVRDRDRTSTGSTLAELDTAASAD